MKAVSLFRERFGGEPDGVWLAPGRANLMGEHTDYNDGFVLPVAIDLGISIALVPTDDGSSNAIFLIAFAFFLGLSTLLDLFVAYFFTRPMVALLGRNRFFTEARFFGVARGLAATGGTS